MIYADTMGWLIVMFEFLFLLLPIMIYEYFVEKGE